MDASAASQSSFLPKPRGPDNKNCRKLKTLRQSGDLHPSQIHDFAPPPHDGFAVSRLDRRPLRRGATTVNVVVCYMVLAEISRGCSREWLSSLRSLFMPRQVLCIKRHLVALYEASMLTPQQACKTKQRVTWMRWPLRQLRQSHRCNHLRPARLRSPRLAFI